MSHRLGVIHTDEDSYRKYWAILAGRSEKDIYIPEALRETGNRSADVDGKTATEDRGQQDG